MFKNIALKTITVAAIAGIFISIAFADCGSYVPYICIAINAAWLGLYAFANKGNFRAWEF